MSSIFLYRQSIFRSKSPACHAQIFFALFITFLFLGTPIPTWAEETKEYTFTHRPRNRSLIAADLHANFSGTGGDLRTSVVANAPGCDVPNIPTNAIDGNSMEIVWPSECVDPEESVTVRITSSWGPMNLEHSHWTYFFAGGEIDSSAIDLDRDVQEAMVQDLQEEAEYYYFWALLVLLVLAFALFLLMLAQKEW